MLYQRKILMYTSNLISKRSSITILAFGPYTVNADYMCFVFTQWLMVVKSQDVVTLR